MNIVFPFNFSRTNSLEVFYNVKAKMKGYNDQGYRYSPLLKHMYTSNDTLASI